MQGGEAKGKDTEVGRDEHLHALRRGRPSGGHEIPEAREFLATTGDLHTFLAGYLKTDFDNPFESHIGIELMVGSITSANFSQEIESVVPLPSRPLPAKQMGVPPAILSDTLRAANPRIEFFNSSTHGYGVLTLTPSELVCEFKSVSTITEPTATLIPLATHTIPVDEVKLVKS